MFSQLGPLFKATFRHAEHSDSRQNLPHEVNKDGRRKDEGPPDNSIDLWEDSTGVSVTALRAFLIDFLAGTTRQTGLAGVNTGVTTPDTPPRPSETAENRHVNPATARAVGAYQSMANRLEPHNTAPAPPVLPTDPPKTDADLVAAGEIRQIHALIADLEVLEQAGVAVLTLEKAESFVLSLKNAVDKALNR